MSAVLQTQICRSQETIAPHLDSYHGFAQPWELIEVAVAEPGRVEAVSVREGDVVRRGALIARLNDSVLRASLEVAQQRASANGEAEAARARLNHAARRRDDIAKLLEESHASQTELDQADLALREAESALLAVQERRDIATAEVAKIQAELSRREIRSPVNGVLIEMNRQPGEYAGGSDHVIAKLAVLDHLRVRLHVPTRVAIGMSVESPIEIAFPEIDSRTTGKVDFVSPVTDSQSGTVRVDIRLDNRSGRLRSGLLGIWRQPQPSRNDDPAHERPQNGEASTEQTGTQQTGTQHTGTQHTGTQHTGTQQTGLCLKSRLQSSSGLSETGFLRVSERLDYRFETKPSTQQAAAAQTPPHSATLYLLRTNDRDVR